MSGVLLIVFIVACGAAGVALAGKPGARLAVWIAGRHRNCAKAHPSRSHAEWVERVHAPAAASFLAMHGRRDPWDVTEIVTFCDECCAAIAYGDTCYAPRTGETLDGLPVVRIVCAACHDGPLKEDT